MNLLKETLSELKCNGKTWDDVVAVQGKDFGISKDKFLQLADRNYDEGYGCEEVASDLIILGKDWWMERGEYDGSEWWEFKRMKPVLPIREDVGDIFTGWRGLADGVIKEG